MTKVVLVGSVKGGTGKTLFSLNLALALARQGKKVYLLDADLTSSYFRHFTKADVKPIVKQEFIRFADWNGIKVFSFGLVNPGPVSMFGFSERQIIEDIYNYSDWKNADVLIIDLPAGAEDVFKETLRLWARDIAGIIVIGIPFASHSMMHLIEMAQYYDLPVLGVVENMAYFECRHCNKNSKRILHIFGEPQGEEIALAYGVPFLGQIPLDPRIYEGLKEGKVELPEDIRQAVDNAVKAIVAAKTGTFWEKWKRKARSYLQNELVKLAASMLVAINKNFDVKGLREKYRFKGNQVFSLVVTDDDGRSLVVLNLKLLDNKLAIVKGRVTPRWIIEIPVRTLIDVIRGYREKDGKKLPFDARTAWKLGELRVYGPGASTMALYIAETLLSDPEVVENARKHLGNLLSLLG